MTPKEKAQELVDKFTLLTTGGYDLAKESALISVDDNIGITFSKETWNKWKIIPQIESTTEYWQEVKEEIQKL